MALYRLPSTLLQKLQVEISSTASDKIWDLWYLYSATHLFVCLLFVVVLFCFCFFCLFFFGGEGWGWGREGVHICTSKPGNHCVFLLRMITGCVWAVVWSPREASCPAQWTPVASLLRRSRTLLDRMWKWVLMALSVTCPTVEQSFGHITPTVFVMLTKYAIVKTSVHELAHFYFQ